MQRDQKRKKVDSHNNMEKIKINNNKYQLKRRVKQLTKNQSNKIESTSKI